jgi:hypothetical protein
MEIEKQANIVEKGVRGHVHLVEHDYGRNFLILVERQNRRLNLPKRVAVRFAYRFRAGKRPKISTLRDRSFSLKACGFSGLGGFAAKLPAARRGDKPDSARFL